MSSQESAEHNQPTPYMETPRFLRPLFRPFKRAFDKWVNRRHPHQQRSVALTAKNIYIFPTAAGLSFCILLALLLIGSINYANNLGYLLTFWLCGLFVVAMLQSYRNLLQLTVHISAGENVFCGEAAQFNVRLVSADKKVKHELLVRTNNTSGLVDSIQSYSDSTCTLNIETNKRGWQKIDRLRISTTWPYGIFQAWTYANINAEILVYPEPITVAFPTDSHSTAKKGEHTAAARDNGDQFEQLKRYEKGEPLSRVSWKIVARTGAYYSKDFQRPISEQLILDWKNLSGSMENRLSQLCYLVVECGRKNTKFGLHLPNKTIESGSGIAHVNRCLTVLATYGQPGN